MSALEMEDPATPVERFNQLDGIVTRGGRAFLEVGRALMEIRDQELWRHGGFTGFEAYLKHHDLDHRHAYRLIDAHSICVAIGHTDGRPPETEGQIRALAALKDRPAEMIQAWRMAQDMASFKDRPMGKEVARAVELVLGHKPNAPAGAPELPWLGDRFDKLIQEIDWWHERAAQGRDHGYWDRIKSYVAQL